MSRFSIASCATLLISLLFLPVRALGECPAALGTNPSSQADELRSKQIDTLLRNAAAVGYSGQVLIATPAGVILDKSYGFLDRANAIPMTSATSLGVGSVAKEFWSAAALLLQSRGRLDLSMPIGSYIDTPAPLRNITMFEILNHTSGLDGEYSEDFQYKSLDSFISAILAHPLRGKPGSAFFYSPEGYTLAAYIIAKQSGQAYPAFLQSALLTNAGMRSSAVESSREAATLQVSHSYQSWTDRGSPSQWPPDYTNVGTGDILTTAEDLYRWECAIDHSSLLPADDVGALRSPQVPDPGDGDGVQYGFGAFYVSENGMPYNETAGDWDFGFNAVVARYTAKHVIVIITSNSRDDLGRSLRQALEQSIEDALFSNKDVSQSLPSMQPPRAAIAGGTYRTGSGALFGIRTDGSYAWLATENQSAIDLLDGRGLTPAERKTNESTALLLGGLLYHGADAYDDFAFPTAGAEAGFKTEWNDLVSSLGALTGYRLFGTAPFARTCRSVVEMRFARLRTPVDMVFTWLPASGTLVGSIPRDDTRPIVLPIGMNGRAHGIAIDVFDPKQSIGLTFSSSGRLTSIRVGSHSPVDII